MLQQYKEIKSRYQDCILFFRLGDFYEMFFEDAQKASQILDVVLTSRTAGRMGRIPMCGIPYHSADTYIAKLLKRGLKVAICEQVEDPRKAKGLVKREVIKVITPGTFVGEDTSSRPILTAIDCQGETVYIALLDLTQAEVQIGTIGRDEFLETILTMQVSEIIYPEDNEECQKLLENPILKLHCPSISPWPRWKFSPDLSTAPAFRQITPAYLSHLGVPERAREPVAGILSYAQEMLNKDLNHLSRISLLQPTHTAYIHPPAIPGLGIPELIKVVDSCATPMGRRTLEEWIMHPLTDPDLIRQRQRAVLHIHEYQEDFRKIWEGLKKIGDIERYTSRIACGYHKARDLIGLRNSLVRVRDLIKAQGDILSQPLLKVHIPEEITGLLESALVEDLPQRIEGNLIRTGFSEEIDRFRALHNQAETFLKRLQEKEIKRTGIQSLRVGYNKVFGYYIEITKANLHLVPKDYIRKQTLTNAERFITEELKQFEEQILSAEEKLIEAEQRIIQDLLSKVVSASSDLYALAKEIGRLDALISFSRLLERGNWIIPEITNDCTIEIKAGRHPIVERHIPEFIPNDTHMDCESSSLLIITGPNMAGKSTYIRQVALIVILAQAGSPVPTEEARIGIADRIFARIGAQDEIFKGQSTFMVEMSQTAGILNNLSPKSLIVLDEIGRGTSTYDGLAIAWAVCEFLAEKKVRTLFATHFHELTALEEEFPSVKNYNVAVKEWNDEVIFLYKIVPGGADQSYGIHVAKIAGIPEPVIQRSRKILAELENGTIPAPTPQNREYQIPLFRPSGDKIIEELRQLDLNTLRPIDALNLISKWKESIE